MSKIRSYDKKHITKKAFESLLKKAAQPLPKRKHAPEETRTEASHPSDGCSGKGKSQDKTGDSEV